MADQIFILGLPRSGSTLLSRLLNETPDILSINDLYYIQKVYAKDAIEATLGLDDAENLTDWILDLSIERGSANNSFIGQFTINKNDVQVIRTKIMDQHQREPFTWSSLMDAVLAKLAQTVGKSRWADKTPQNFMHLDLLHGAFPQARFLFLFRDPRNILASYKFAGGEGHDRRRYHPCFYSLYWRTAVRKYFASTSLLQTVEMVRYEDLLSNLKGEVQRLNTFLHTEIPIVDLNAVGDNSSFTGSQRQVISQTEKWICQIICRTEMASLGYKEEPAKLLIKDVPELIFLSLRFSLFQTLRVCLSKDSRKRISTFIQQLFGKKK